MIFKLTMMAGWLKMKQLPVLQWHNRKFWVLYTMVPLQQSLLI